MAIVSSAQLRSRVAYSGKWSLPQVAGRFAEISGSKATAVLSLTFGLVLDAQERGEPVGWATSTESSVVTCAFPNLFACPLSYKERKKFRRFCFWASVRSLNLLMTAFDSDALLVKTLPL